MKLPIDLLIKNTPRSRQDKARNEVRIASVTKKTDRLRNTKSVIIKATTHNTDKPHKYICTVEYEGDKAYRSKNLVVSCTCPDHMFTWEYALNKAGMARIQFSNGEPPHDRNPRNIAGVCGHMFRALVLIKRRAL